MAAAQRSYSRSLKAFSALSVFGAVVLAVNANVLVARWYERWDVTSEGLYTLSHATKSTLAALPDRVEVVVLLSRADPLLPRVRQMLTAYAAETTQLDVRYVDPERSPAEFALLQQKHRILTGTAEDGRLVTDAAIVIARGDKAFYVTAGDVTAFDDEGRARPRLEQALTEGIADVLSSERATFCFAEGQREASVDDVGPEGLSDLRHALEKSNLEVASVNLAQPDADRGLARCHALAIVGPSVAYASSAVERVVHFVEQGGSLALFATALVGEDGRTSASGLDPLAALAGVELGRDVVLEADPSARLPRGAGEVFFAGPLPHDVTSGLVRGDKVDFRVLLSEAQSLRPKPEADARALLVSSEQALALQDLGPILQGKGVEGGARERRTLAVALERPKPPSSTRAHGPRLVVVGAANPPWNRSFRDAALIGNRLFVENALSWLVARPALVSVPEKSAHEIGLSLTEDALGEVLRYVLVYMPGVGALLGVLVLLERRNREKRSREKVAQVKGAE